MKISREWATPLTVGIFAIMAVTGVLMFFHRDIGFNKLAHEWLGWAMIAGVFAHVVANWFAFKRYFLSSNLARGLMGACTVVLALTFITPPGAKRQASPPVMAMRAVISAPLASIAPVAGKSAETLIDDLARAGIVLPHAQASVASIVKDDRALQGKAVRAIFGGG
ncbi:MAG: DUF4405 domain-containing protein [Rhodoblastus sp.]